MGMEPNFDYFRQASKVVEAFENVNLQVGGFGDIEAVEQFDIVAAINGSFYYLLKIEERIDALYKMFQALRGCLKSRSGGKKALWV